MSNINLFGIVIIDFGSQYTQLVARRIRDLKVYSIIVSPNITKNQLLEYQPKGIILSGGPASVYAANAPKIPEFIFELNLPILGICYGMQAMVQQLGGKVSNCENAEYGLAKLEILSNTKLFNSESLHVWMSHGDSVLELPQNFEIMAETINTPIAAINHVTNPWFGLQFHPEVTHTEGGQALLQNFVLEICKASTSWQTDSFISNSVAEIQQIVGEDLVLLGLSGGVDSSALALLLHKAIGEKLYPVFVDTGLLRANEVSQVTAMFQNLGIKIYVIDAATRFLKALERVTCPEKKRKIIGKLFITIFKEFASQYKQCKWLAQGTIYPDVIESAGDNTTLSVVIKSHHNVGGLPKKLGFKLLEPFRELFKDEVRKIALHLGLPEAMIKRHPFPGPGLAVRIAGAVSLEKIECLKAADKIFMEVLKKHDWYHKIGQAFAVYVPVKTVAVKGDGRKYEAVICLRAVITQDFMTADVAKIPYEILLEASSRITNEVAGVSRVLYDISNKPPATIEWE